MLSKKIPWNKGIHTGHAPWLGKKRSIEDRRKMSEARLARRERLGYINAPDVVEKIAVALRGRPHSPETRAKLSIAMKGRLVRPIGWHHSIDTRQRLSRGRLGVPRPDLGGENSPNWKGGITPDNARIRHSIQYRAWRTSVFERDDYRCFDYGARSGNGKRVILEAHHIFSFALFPRLRLAIENGITLCHDCHERTKLKGPPVYSFSF
jgi:hypothetical protein